LLQPGSAIQAKWDEAARLCRTPTPTLRPTARPIPPIITGTATVTATTTTSGTQSTLSATGSILFSRFNDQELQWEIVAVTPGGDTPTVILSDATQPATSPNGQLLAYHAEVDESEGLHVFNVATDKDTRATTFREDVTPDWAPDNLRFVFPSQRSGDRRWQVYIGWADGKGDPVPLTDGRTPAWSPDGTLIAYQGTDVQGNNPGLYLISAQGGPATRLTEGESDRAPAWSPNCAKGVPTLDGNTSPVSSQGAVESDCQVAFMSTKDGNWEIYVANVFRGTVTRLTTSSGNDGLPTWSPDGDQIAFVSDRGGSWGVYAMPATGGEAVKVANWGEAHTNWLVERIAWVR
jgi:TolB protein